MLKTIRRILAVLCFVAVTLLFLDFTGTLHHWLGWTAKVQFFPAVLALNVAVIAVLVLITLVFGRIYCSVICPLGVMQDLISWLHGKFKKNRFSYSKEMKWLRYPVLVVFIALLVVGVGSILTLLEPYGTYGMIATNLFQPIYQWCNNGLAAIAEHYESYAFYSTDVWVKSGIALALSAGLFLIIGFLAWRGGRTYCNTICPVGTLLSFVSRFSLLKVRIDDDKCIKCGLCTRNCKASCINHEDGTVDHSRCVTCGNCISKCKKDAIYYGRPRKNSENVGTKPASSAETEGNNVGTRPVSSDENQKEPIDNGKRAFLIGAGTAVAVAAFAQAKKKVDGGLAAIEDKEMPKRKNPITPPGSWNARHMQQHCTACQLCVAECPNQVLVPSHGLLTLMQPMMTYERGYCRPECIRCSQVCPTGAIKPITFEDKSSIKIGTAVWSHFLCIPIRDKDKDGNPISCGSCANHCPTGAITMIQLEENNENSPMVPSINAAKCIGCGACEYVCPSRPVSAIHVEGLEDHRTI
ncbi:MAG: 4Fe-4S binding protein [Muribaculaceae bacterium]|nr:4Fe-4S binding protein [Muribaculaceae bacterium]